MTTARFLGFAFGVPGTPPESPYALTDVEPCTFTWGADLAGSTFKIGAHTMPMVARDEVAEALQQQLDVAASIVAGTADTDSDGVVIVRPSPIKIGTQTINVQATADGLSVDFGTATYPTAKAAHLRGELLAHVPAQS